MAENLKLFATRLKNLRIEKGYTQEELADLIDCAPGLISYYETMQREPGFSNILALCEVFGATNLIPNLITSIYRRAAPRLFFDYF